MGFNSALKRLTTFRMNTRPSFYQDKIIVWRWLQSKFLQPWNSQITKRCWNIYIVSKFLIIKPSRCTYFFDLCLEWNSTCFGQYLCPSSGVFFTVYTAMVYVIQVCWQFASRIRMELQFHPDPTVSKPVWHIPLLCAQWKTPDDEQRNCSETCRVSFPA